jgi:hypothetical protein
MVGRGTFVLHDAVRPALPDGAYEINVTQTLDPPGNSVDPLDKHLVVTGPRFTLPPDQPLSFYPPNNAVGAFSTRLPQIVLRRRTLPWERYVDPADPTLPWLALVVLAPGEGQVTTGQPVDTTSLPDPDLRDSDTRDVLNVTERVVQEIFPTKEDLPWLCHAREVDLSDTELALGEDDGFMAVVLANRLPQPGLQYTACLISLEGHGDDLPTKEVPADLFSRFTVYTAAEVASAAVLQRQQESLVDQVSFSSALAPAPARDAQVAADAQPVTLVGARRAATTPQTLRDAWSSPAMPAGVNAGQQAGSRTKSFIAGTTSVAGLSIDPTLIDPEARLVEFTVLKHWSFTCDQGGDFESLMRELDDGMLGTLPAPAAAAPAPGTPPGAPSTSPDPVITDTGHVQVSAISRSGDRRRAWYRGPFTPRQILRAMPDDSGLLPLLHTADQARRVGPDGLEDLSLAAAFEIGRLLAVAQPTVVAGLLSWRQDGFGRARLRRIVGQAGALQQVLEGNLDENRAVFSAGIAASLLGRLGTAGAARLGPVRPLSNPAPDLVGPGNDLAGVVAQGFGLDTGQVGSVLTVGPSARGLDPSVTRSVLPGTLADLSLTDFAGVQAALAAHVSELAGQAQLLGGGGGG